MKFVKGLKARKTWKRMSTGGNLTGKAWIKMMLEAEMSSKSGQQEIDKKRAKKKETVAGIEVTA